MIAVLKERQFWKRLGVILGIMFVVVGSAFMVIHQVFEYRHDYRTYNKLIKEKEDLNAEWGRLLIEQQTFGATAQIGTRAVTQLRMYSPPATQTVVMAKK